MEAISFGCPVVTTYLSGVDGLVDGENGMLISTLDSDLVVSGKVCLLVEYDVIFRKISKFANELLEYYSVRQYKERIKMFINSLGH